MTYAEKIREKIDEAKKKKREFWDKVRSNSRTYMEVLKVDEADLKELEELAESGFLFDLNGERFGLFVKHVCAWDYGADWQYCVMACCKSNTSLNRETGHGTTLICAVPDEWHQKIIKHLGEKK